MSEPTKTTLWTGKHVKLVKTTGYSSYSHGHNHYRPGNVSVHYLSQMDGYSYGLHSLDTKPDKDQRARLTEAGQTWGRLTPAIIAKLIEKAQAIDVEIPAKRKAKKDKQDAEEAASALAKKQGHDGVLPVLKATIARSHVFRDGAAGKDVPHYVYFPEVAHFVSNLTQQFAVDDFLRNKDNDAGYKQGKTWLCNGYALYDTDEIPDSVVYTFTVNDKGEILVESSEGSYTA